MNVILHIAKFVLLQKRLQAPEISEQMIHESRCVLCLVDGLYLPQILKHLFLEKTTSFKQSAEHWLREIPHCWQIKCYMYSLSYYTQIWGESKSVNLRLSLKFRIKVSGQTCLLTSSYSESVRHLSEI